VALVDRDFIEETEGKHKYVHSVGNIEYVIDKIEVMLTAVGKAPKLKVNKFKVKRSHTF
jgi:predicted transcriptional regulator